MNRRGTVRGNPGKVGEKDGKTFELVGEYNGVVGGEFIVKQKIY